MFTTRTAVMSAAVLTALIGAPSIAQAQNFSGLAGVYNTGASSANSSSPSQLADSAADTPWTVSGPSTSGTQTAFVTDSSTFPFPYWQPNTSESKWISPQANYNGFGSDGVGAFTYTTTFSVLAGYNASQGTIAGYFADDNHVTAITLNGVTHTITGDPGFPTFTNFSLTGLQSGVNTLSFTVDNAYNNPGNTGNPTGLNVKFDGALSGAAPTPEGSTMLSMVLLTLGGGVFLMRSRKRTSMTAA